MNRNDLLKTLTKAFEQIDADNGVLSDEEAIQEIEDSVMLEVPTELKSTNLASIIADINSSKVISFPDRKEIAIAARNGEGNLSESTLEKLNKFHSED